MATPELVQYLTEIDTEILLILNGMHSPFWDHFMHSFSGKMIWIPMYASLLLILLKIFHWKAALCYTVAIALTITFADQMCSTVIRPYIERLRPSNLENPLSEFIHIVNGKRGGSYGFPSCHASNTFGLAFFLICLFRQRWLSLFFILWALLTCYSRAYLGVHYPGDLLVGAIIGSFGGWLFYWIGKRALVYIHPSSILVLEDKSSTTAAYKHTRIIIFMGLLTIVSISIYAAIVSYL